VARRRWVYVDGEAIEVTSDYMPEPKNTDAVLWSDRNYEGMRATDGTPIDSRSRHREYMKVNNLALMDDFKESFAQSQQRKAEYVTQGKHAAVKRADIERAIHTLQRRK
jgi:hypothetical protein